jgi:signal transduction histidine kinase
MLKTVRVPEGIAAPFAAVEELVSRFFRDRKDDPQHGTIEIFGERYLLVRAASLSVEFFTLVADLYGPGREREADEFSRNILFDLAHAIGKSDARNFHSKMGLADPIARLSAGPIHFAHAGWAFVDIDPSSRPAPGPDFYLLYDHPYSFEADAWLRTGKTREFAACIMNAGYSSGWCEESFGVELVATEISCRAKGDPQCRFVMAHPRVIERKVADYFARGDAAGVPGGRGQVQIPDFFARKRMEEALRQARDELEQRVAERTAELREANERLRREVEERRDVERQLRQTQKLDAIGRLAGGIAHDFNNLMAVVVANANLLARRMPEDDPSRALLGEIATAGQRGAGLTRQLLAFGKAQFLSPTVLDVGSVVADLVRMLARVIGEDVTLQLDLDPETFTRADRGQLEQVVINLIVNARDAMRPRGGTLRIGTKPTALDAAQARSVGVSAGGYVCLSVTDTGSGMDEHVLAHIFEPFFSTKTEQGGTGLGLSTVYGIVKQAGGGIRVTSEPGRGARFDVYLPHSDAPSVVSPPPPDLRAARGAETILLVEDQGPLRRVARTMLEDLGYTVLDAPDGPEALRLLRERGDSVALLLTDVVMPGMRGPDLAAAARVLRPDLRVLFMSGFVGESLAPRAEGQPDALVAKPFTFEDLAARIREVLSRPP